MAKKPKGDLIYSDWEYNRGIFPHADGEHPCVRLSAAGLKKMSARGRGYVCIGFMCENMGILKLPDLLPFIIHEYMKPDPSGEDTLITVEILVDDNPPYKDLWRLNPDCASVFPQEVDADVKAMMRQMAAGKTVSVRVANSVDGQSFTSTYSLKGLGEAMKHLSCYKELYVDKKFVMIPVEIE